MSQLLFQPEWKPPKLDSLPQWEGARRVCVDVETRDDHLKTLGPGVRRGGYITSVQFAIEGGPAHFLPIRFGGGDNMDPQRVMAYIVEQASTFRGEIVGANLQYDLDYLQEAGVTFPRVKWFRDVQLAGPIIDEYRTSYSLEALAKLYELPGKSDDDLKDACKAHGIRVVKNSKKWMGSVWKLPARYVAEYGIQDVRLPLQILREQQKQIDSQDLQRIFDLECRVLPVVLKMRRRGVRVDTKKLAKIEDFSVQQETQALEELYAETGVRVAVGDVWVTEPLVKALGTIGVECPKTKDKKGNDTDTDSVEAGFLRSLNHPVADSILRARQMNKLRTTFVNLIRNNICGDRIHCTFNQLRRTKDMSNSVVGTITGRLSSSNPNMQFQPSKKSVVGSLWREVYVPDEGKLWAACDYSQQEFRLVVHFAVRAGCRGAQAAAQAYHDNPDIDAHDAVAELVGIARDPAKTINFGVIYGMGGGKMCRSLGLPTVIKSFEKREDGIVTEIEYEAEGEEGEKLLENFHARAPYLSALAKKAKERALVRGYVVTLLGRRCRFPAGKEWGRDYLNKALNKLIQGSASDQTKRAMVECDAAGHELQIQVHDELDLSVESREQAEDVARIMRECCPLNVPVKVDVELGPSWGAAK